MKSLAIREKKFGVDNNPSCGDCLLNLGILYKQRGQPEKATNSFMRALKIRIVFIGNDSTPTSNVHEELGKFHLEEQGYE